jgi:hypothetical protein
MSAILFRIVPRTCCATCTGETEAQSLFTGLQDVLSTNRLLRPGGVTLVIFGLLNLFPDHPQHLFQELLSRATTREGEKR